MDDIPVEVPAENVYYYEVNRGDFRLLYFIPAGELKNLISAGRCNHQALVDYPDGVDLPCTESAFREFKEEYGYRPEYAPDDLRNAFYAVWTDTSDSKDGTHSGFLPSAVLEECIPDVKEISATIETEIGPKVEFQEASIEQRRRYQAGLDSMQAELKRKLESFHVDSVDGKRSIAEQAFQKIRMQEGMPIDELFNQMNRNSER